MAKKTKLHNKNRFSGRVASAISAFFGVAIVKSTTYLIQKLALIRYETTYKLHLKTRAFHDVLVIKSPGYKKLSENQYTVPVKNATIAAFMVSLLLFTSFQFLLPYLNPLKPGEVQAGATSKTWTTNGDFAYNKSSLCGATTQSQIAISGAAYTDATCAAAATDANLSLSSSSFPAAPATVSGGGSLTSDGLGNIYAFTGNSTTAFFKFSTATNTWSAMASALENVGASASLTYYNGYVYAAIGNSVNFYRYSVAGNSWGALTSSPSSFVAGKIESDGAGNIFANPGGTDFYKYSISGNSWAVQTAPPTSTRGLSYYSGYVYATPSAISPYNLYRYSVSGNSWTIVNSSIPSVSYGGYSLRSDGSGNLYYAPGAGSGLYKYSISGNSWSTLATSPSMISVGGDLAYYGSNIYVFTGMNNTNFYKYNVTGNQWTTNTPTYTSPGTISGLKIDSGVGQKQRWATISETATKPANTSTSYMTRGSDDGSTWTSFVALSGANIQTVPSRYLDVQVTLATSDGVSTPTLNDFTVSYDNLEAPTNANITLTRTDGNPLYTSAGVAVTGGVANVYTNEASVKVTATGLTCTGCGTSANIRPEVEVKPVGTAFTGTGTLSATAGNNYVMATGLSAGTSYHMQVRAIDDQGRASAWTPYGGNADPNGVDIAVEQTAPTGSVVINNPGDQFTTTGNVTLNSTAADTGGAGVGQMRFSETGTFDPAGADWLPYLAAKPWTLSAGDGPKNLYAQYRDNAGNVSQTLLSSTTEFSTGTRGTDIALNPGNFGVSILKPNGMAATNVTECLSNYISAGVCAVNPWISGIGAAMSGKSIYFQDSTSTYWAPNPGGYGITVGPPQANTGLDTNYPAYYSLVANNGVDFSGYPARNACVSVGGRLPTSPELSSIYDNRASYTTTTFQAAKYWTATSQANPASMALTVDFSVNNSPVMSNITFTNRIRCVSDTAGAGAGAGGVGTAGTFVSPVKDVGANGFKSIDWNTVTSPGTITMEVNAGDVSVPDVTWTGYKAIGARGGSDAALVGKPYIQYRATLSFGAGTVPPQLTLVSVSANPISASITVDAQAPTGSLTINTSNPAYTGSTTVTAYLNPTTPEPGSSGIKEFYLSNNGVTWTGPTAWNETYRTSGAGYAWTLASGADGNRSVYVKYVDNAGNIGGFFTPVTSQWLSVPGNPAIQNYYQDLAPANWTVSGANCVAIGGRLPSSTEISVYDLSLSNSASYYWSSDSISETIALAWSTEFGITENRAKSSSGQTHCVRDFVDNSIQDTISLDTTTPVATNVPTLNANLNNSGNQTVSWTTFSDPAPSSAFGSYTVQRKMLTPTLGTYTDVIAAAPATNPITNEATLSYVDIANLDQGTYVYRILYKDAVGNTGTTGDSATLTVDKTTPTLTSLTIGSGAAYATTATQNLTLTGAADTGGAGLTEMQFSNDGVVFDDWETYNATKSNWNLNDTLYGGTTGDGVKTVYVKLRDAAGNMSGTFTQTSDTDFNGGTATPTGSVKVENGVISLQNDSDWITIGSQTWMTSNLDLGNMINYPSELPTDNGIVEKYCYNNDSANCLSYGGLYQWNELMQYTTTLGAQGICPVGSHLPTDLEYKTLEVYLGMSQAQADTINSYRGTDQGTKLKSNGTSGYNELLGGFNNGAGFMSMGGYSYIASSTQLGGAGYGYTRYVSTASAGIFRFNNTQNMYISARCLKDSSSTFMSPATFESSIRNAITQNISYSKATWNATTPSGTSIAVSARAGNTATPDGTWTTYQTLTSGASIASNSVLNKKQYLQYKVEMTGGAATPTFSDITFETSNTSSITLDTAPPPDVTNLKAYTNSGKTTEMTDSSWQEAPNPYFEWNANVSDTAGYKYCFGASNCTPSIDRGTNTNVTLDLSSQPTYPDGTYYFKVVAYDAATNTSVTPTQYTYKLDRSTPGAVTGFSASQNQETAINLSWSNIYDPNGSPITYIVEKILYTKYLEGFSVVDVGPDKIWSNQVAYGYTQYTGLVGPTYIENIIQENQGLKYVYRIKATDESGKTGSYQVAPVYGLTRDGVIPTTPYSVTATPCTYQTPANCSNPSNDALKGHEITLAWTRGFDGGTGIDTYLIYRSPAYSLVESDYTLIYTMPVANPLPVVTSLTYVDNTGIADYTPYYYRIIARDGSTPANKSQFIPAADENYASVRTPDVTAPTAPVVTASPGGLDDSNAAQKTVITWTTSTDAGVGVKTYKLYRAIQGTPDATDQGSSLVDGDFTDITTATGVTCDLTARSCTEQGLADFRYYYYRVKAIDNDPYNNISNFSTNAVVKTLSSAVPTPPRGRIDPDTRVVEPYPYALTTKGDTSNPLVGHEAKVYFSGSYEKDCTGGVTAPCLVLYEIYRSTDNVTWAKVGQQTPTRTDNDRDNEYTFTDTGLTDATTYYYQVRAIGNNPDIPQGGITSSNIGGTKNQGWDTTPDATGPTIPNGGLEVKVRDTHPNEIELRNIITWKVLTADTVSKRNGTSDFSKYLVRRETYNPTTNALISDDIVSEQTNMSVNYYMDVIGIAFVDLKYKYYIQVVDNAGTDYKYADNTVINTFSNLSAKEYSPDTIIPSKAKPVLVAPVTLSNISVASAEVSWTTDQNADSIVQFRPAGSTGDWMIDGRVERTTAHNVKLVSLSPNTTYEYLVISRNYLGNKIEDLGVLPELRTTGFDITPGAVVTTTSGATFEWKTNLDAKTALVEYKLNRQPGDDPQGKGVSVDPETIIASPRDHKVVMQGLKSNRTYTYKIKSTSTDNYNTETGFMTFNTKAFDSAQFTLAPASSNVAERNITATTAQIVWQTETPTTSWVDYSTTSGTYDGAAGNNDLTQTHVIVIEGLIPGTKYFYRVRVKDANEVEYTSQEYSFTAVLKPKISNMTVKNITPYSATISWDTNVETETIVNWGTTTAYGEKRGKSGMSKVHELVIDNLLDNQEYHYQILAKDETGNEVADTDKIIRTPLDTEGPKITGVKIDVLPMGENDTTSSVIVSWMTNKPATTLVEYDEGVIGGTYGKQSVQDNTLNNSHTVIIKDLAPATSYHYRLVSSDKRNNKTISQDYTFVTPTKEKSILQLILKSLEETFAWTRNLNQFFGNIGKRLTGN